MNDMSDNLKLGFIAFFVTAFLGIVAISLPSTPCDAQCSDALTQEGL